MANRRRVTAEATATEIASAAPDFALLPVGACEQHGSHLPLFTDALTASVVAERVTDRLGGYLLPTLPFSSSIEHRGFAGTIPLRMETLARVIRDVVLGCRAFGCRRVAILSGHGGNWVLKPAVRELNADLPDMRIVLVPEPVLWGGALGDDLHAGQIETSIMLSLRPDLVKGPITDTIPAAGREFLDYLPMREVSPSGVWGYPSRGTAEEGERVLNEMTDRVARYLTETLAALGEPPARAPTP